MIVSNSEKILLQIERGKWAKTALPFLAFPLVELDGLLAQCPLFLERHALDNVAGINSRP
jgi:hypothetical protein